MGRTRVAGGASGETQKRAGRCVGLREQRMLVEGLESRLLLAATLIPFTNHYGSIFDGTRNQLDVVGTSGVSRYNAATGALLSTINVLGWPGPGDITPDGNYLLLTDRQVKTIHKINLNTGADTEIPYTTTGSGEVYPISLVVVSNSTAYFSSAQSGSGNSYPIHTLDIASGTVGNATISGLNSVYAGVMLYRSADRASVIIGNGAPELFDVATNSVAGQAASGVYWFTNFMAVSPGGALTATYSNSAITVLNHQEKPLYSELPQGSMIFSPVYNTLYIIPTGSSSVLAYDTTTFKEKASFDLGESVPYNWYDPVGEGMMAASADGKTLFVQTNDGVRMVNVDESGFSTVTLSASAPTWTGTAGITFTVNVSGSPSGMVTFSAGNITVGTAPIIGNTATFVATSAFGGVDDIQASYVVTTTGATEYSPMVAVAAPYGSGNEIYVGNHLDQIFDPTRNQLDIATVNGDIVRYDLGTHQVAGVIHIDGAHLGYGDITQDGHYLYMTDQTAATIHKVDLVTGTYKELQYIMTGSGEQYAFDLKILSGNLAIFDTTESGSGNRYNLHSIDLTTDAFGNATSNGTAISILPGSLLFRSADYSTAYLDNYGAEDTDHIYSAATKSITASGKFSGFVGAISRDGSYIATANGSSTTLYDRNYHLIANTLPTGDLAFSTTSDILYIVPDNSSTMYAYDVHTLAVVGTYNVGESGQFGLWWNTDSRQNLLTISPDGNTAFVGTMSGTRAINISASATPPTPILWVSTTSANLGDSITFTVQIPLSAGFWAGSIFFKNGNQTLGSAMLDSYGTASLATSALPAGTDSITAVFQSYGGQFATSSPLSVTVNRATPTVTLTESQIGLPTVAPVMLATVSGIAAMPGGIVDLYEGNTLLGTGTLVNGQVQITPGSLLAIGVHALTAVYHGDVNYTDASSAAFNIDVEQLRTSATLSLDQPAKVADPEIFDVSVFANGPVGPTGSVELFDGNAPLGIWPYSTVQSTGTLTLDAPLSVGTHSISALYVGDPNYLPSKSANVSLTVAQISTSLRLSTSSPNAHLGDQVTFTAVISAASVPAGSVSFYDGTTLLGNGAVSSGYATLTLSNLSVGTHSIQAIYNGNVSYSPATSNILSETITQVTVVDLLVLYTEAAANSVFDIQSVISGAVAQTNQAMANSLIPVVINVVDAEEINYTESGSYVTDLTRLQNASDGFMDGATALRQKYHADLVSLFVNGASTSDSDGSLIGLGSELNTSSGDVNQAYSVVDAQEADNYVLAHELGHNFGARHDVQNDPDSGGFQTAHGYRFTGNNGVLYHDIMSYDPGQTIPYYSNPNVTYAGVPEGTANANAAATITANAAVVANYSSLLAPIGGAVRPTGVIESTTNMVITGWGYDANLGSGGAMVRLDVDGKTGTPFAAKLPRQDLEPTLGSPNHGFTFTLPTTLADGQHTVTLWVQDSPGASYVQVDSTTVTVDKRPDLTLAFGTIAKALISYLPGDVITVPVLVRNIGSVAAAASAAHAVAVDVRISTDGTYSTSDLLAQRLWIRSPIVAGGLATLSATFTLTAAMGTGPLRIVGMADSLATLAEIDETNNTAALVHPLNVVWQFGSVAGRSGSTAFTFNDIDGTRIALTLIGGGTGTLIRSANGYGITITGSTAKSVLTIATTKTATRTDNGRFTLSSLTVGNPNNAKDHTAIGSIVAGTTDLAGNLKIAGTLGSVTIGNVVGPAAINIRSAGGNATLTMGTVQDLAITSASAIKQLTVTNWTASDVALNGIVAPSLAAFTVTGDPKRKLPGNFTGNVTISGTLGKVTIAGHIGPGVWTVKGKHLRG